VLLKPNQRGTLSETLQCWQAARNAGYAAIVSARSGETEDTTIVDLAIGWQVGQLKVGSFARGERMAKWNAVLRIEEAAGAAPRARREGRGADSLPPLLRLDRPKNSWYRRSVQMGPRLPRRAE
jgi:enolase